MAKEKFLEGKTNSSISINDYLENLCAEINNQPKVRFCGVINNMGRLIAGGLRGGIEPLENEDQRQMLYIQSYLEISMKKEFDETQGSVDHLLTYRDNIVLISIPLRQDHLLLLSTERNAEINQIIQITRKIFGDIRINEENQRPLCGNPVISPEFV